MGGSAESQVLQEFGIPPGQVQIRPIAGGYINKTFAVGPAGAPLYVLQQINTSVFPQPGAVMANLELALPYLKSDDYTALELIPSASGASWVRDAAGIPWRMLRYVPNSRSFLSTGSPGIARETGRILGRFHQLISPLDPQDFMEVFPRFHDLAWRVEQLVAAREKAPFDREQEAAPYLVQALRLAQPLKNLPWNRMPVRTCHNDTKLSNLLFDIDTEQGLCLIDLDTLGAGYLLYDLGDALRTLMNPLPEDHPDWEEIELRPSFFEAFVKGVRLSGLVMSDEEVKAFPSAPVLMPLLHGIRALTDYLMGDVYYRVEYPEQNLVRARNLIRVASETEKIRDELAAICRQTFS